MQNVTERKIAFNEARIPKMRPLRYRVMMENFGSYRSDNNQVYFDLNDFDEAILAPVTWEVVRLVTSIFLGFESLGIDARRSEKMAMLFLKSY